MTDGCGEPPRLEPPQRPAHCDLLALRREAEVLQGDPLLQGGSRLRDDRRGVLAQDPATVLEGNRLVNCLDARDRGGVSTESADGPLERPVDQSTTEQWALNYLGGGQQSTSCPGAWSTPTAAPATARSWSTAAAPAAASCPTCRAPSCGRSTRCGDLTFRGLVDFLPIRLAP